ncbi:MAG: ATP-binding protein [Egibacteraceae bacterium]
MTIDRRALFGGWLERLTLAPIDPSDPSEDRYVPLQEAGRGAVNEIFSRLDLSIGATTQLLSGPSGSGKTTELYRLKGLLEDTGFTVVLIDMLQFVNESTAIDPIKFLIALGLGVGNELLPVGERAQRGFARRFREFLARANVSIAAGPLEAHVSAERVEVAAAGLSVAVDLERELKNSEPFVAELRTKLAFQLGNLYDEVAAFLKSLVAQDRQRRPDGRGVVVIVDSLEKVRGVADHDELVQTSVQELFVHHSAKLRFNSHHTVYTVPPYLLFTAPGALAYDGGVRPVPIPQVRRRQGQSLEPNAETIAEMVEIVARRIPWEQLFKDSLLLERVILESGGHLRDLCEILQEIVTLAYSRGVDPPVDRVHVDEAIANVAHGFSNPTQESAELMRRVHRQHGRIEPRADEVAMLARLMHTHMLLAHCNAHDRYEVHPLAQRALGLA